MGDSRADLLSFPFFLLNSNKFPDEFETLIRDLDVFSCRPTYPWAQWFYHKIIKDNKLAEKGAFAEFGVALGGMSLFLARAFDQKVYAFDTYEGTPFGSGDNENSYYKHGDYTAKESTHEERILTKAKEIGVKDKLQLIKGDFSTGKSTIEVNEPISFVHLDCNLYSSTTGALEIIYENLVDGGVIAIDEFFHHSAGVKRALFDFFKTKGIIPLYHPIFPYSAIVIKGESVGENVPEIMGDYYDFKLLKEDLFIAHIEKNIKKLKMLKEDYSTAQTVLNILKGETSSHDIHLYLWALQSFWNTFWQRPEDVEQREVLKK